MADVARVFPHSRLLEPEFEQLLLAFDRAQLTCTDLIILDAKELAQRCNRSITEIRKALEVFQQDTSSRDAVATISRVQGTVKFTTGCAQIDEILDGGIATGYITEVAGQSAAGKSNLLAQLSLSVQFPPEKGGLNKSTLYISTESAVETRRLVDMMKGFAASGLEASSDRVHCLTCWSHDELEHVLRYQVPVAVKTFNVGLIVIDSIAAHYRAEFDAKRPFQWGTSLMQLARDLRRLATTYNLAVVVANQVTDRVAKSISIDNEWHKYEFVEYQTRWYSGWPESAILHGAPLPSSLQSPPLSSPYSPSSSQPTPTPQPRFSHSIYSAPKVPSLGPIWANCIDTRIVLKRSAGDSSKSQPKRSLSVVFSPFSAPATIDFDITTIGVRGVTSQD